MDDRMQRRPSTDGRAPAAPPSRRPSTFALAIVGGVLLLLGVALNVFNTPEGSTSAAKSAASGLEASIALDVQRVETPSEAAYVFTLGVMAPADEAIKLQFDSGQMYEFVVTQGDREVWRFSVGRAFHQAVHSRTVDAGALQTFVHVWDGRDGQGNVVVGEVEARASLMINTPRTTSTISFDVF